MSSSLRWKVVAAVAAVLAAVAAGAAIASTGHDGRGPERSGPRRVLPPLRAPGPGLGAAATYLGLTAPQLAEQLRSGKTLAQIAGATDGKSVDGLVDALVAAGKQRLESAVSAGRLTREQADRIEAELKERVTARVDGTAPRRPGLGRGRLPFRGGPPHRGSI
jgi:hypothetical protein